MVAAGLAVAAGTAALLSARGLRRELTALRRDLAGLRLPGPRASSADIRSAVAEALADERERELAEARAFWAEQESRETAGEGIFFRGGLYGATADADSPAEAVPDYAEAVPDYEVPPVLPSLPRQSDFAGLEPEAPEVARPAPGAIPHPSGPDFAPSPVVASRDQTAERLADLADARVPLSDVRPGPLGTLDVYVFADGTTLCMTPGHRETALRLSTALDRGEVPVLRGGSAIAGAYALTFAFGEESVYVLADRVVASL
ncbi:hypothetical protein GTW78_26885 [Streptomyces sp. SID4948]|uniref:hypothetical protein n=1 Tax=Streptomyces sp. SID4948 TaxID=2690287 RepID=UPI000B853401|nr:MULTISPECIES: hypothetical protein [unclassified Streptomyces]MYS23672.1 hypothetical protein [Streptomyces sp. SID4948]